MVPQRLAPYSVPMESGGLVGLARGGNTPQNVTAQKTEVMCKLKSAWHRCLFHSRGPLYRSTEYCPALHTHATQCSVKISYVGTT